MSETADLASAADEDLVVRLRWRDYPAFVVLFDRYRARALSFAARMTGDADAAENLTHDVFARVASQASQFNAKRPFRVWFFTMLRDLVAEHVSKARPEVRTSLERIAAARPVADTSSLAARAEEAKEVYNALNRLKPVYREVVYLRLYEQMSYDEVAEITGEKTASVRNRMNYAVEQLRKELHS